MPIRALCRPVVGVLGGLVLVAGCSAGTDTSPPSSNHSSDKSSDKSSERTTSSPTSSPASSPTASASTAAEPTSPGPLLGAAELPGFDGSYQWRPGTTSHREPPTSFGTCQRFGLLAIGAERVVVRRFRPPTSSPTDRAGELVATFPDTVTARRAYAVLTAWRQRCADRLSHYRTHRVGTSQDVPVPGGSAGWYLLTYGPVPGSAGKDVLDAQGTALVGSRIAMLTMVRTAGHDAPSSPGREPMAVAVGRAAAKIG